MSRRRPHRHREFHDSAARSLPGLTSGPALGAAWDPVVDHTVFAPFATLDALLVTLGSTSLDVGAKGTLFCDPPFIPPIPDDPILLGFDLCFQAVSFPVGASFKFTNALDITFGLAPLEWRGPVRA